MKIAILGFDGYYGYPLYERLKNNHDVLGIDNFWRRSLSNSPSLIPRDKPQGVECDVADYDSLFKHLKNFKPDVVIHLAEQRSAPWSMQNIKNKQHTITNNTMTTLSVLECAKKLEFKVVHIGSMGVYGYNSNKVINEGDTVRGPGSLYHLSKCFDNSMFEMYNRLYGCDIAELHQGIMWGIGGRFDYDETFGTVLNRFILQRMIGMPLTLYGQGNQLRPFIHIKNSLDCVELVINNFKSGFNTYNQYTEIKKISELLTSKNDHNFRPINYNNPRIEDENNSLKSTNAKLTALGLNTININETEIKKIENIIKPYLKNVNKKLIEPNTLW